MKRRKLGLAVAAMALALQLGGTAAAAPNLDQLNTIAELLGENDVTALRTYIEANPELIEGEGTLAALLRRFMAESVDIATYLAMDPDLEDALVGQLSAGTDPVDEGSDPGDDDGGGEGPDDGAGENPDDGGSIY